MRKALISVSNKDGIVDFAQFLVDHGYEILSTGGTADVLEEAGISVIRAEEYTGMKESPLLKTMHHKISGGIFYAGDDEKSIRFRKLLELDPINIVVNNFYDFEGASKKGIEEAINNIDVGGPTMIRIGAKMGLLNGGVAVVTGPKQHGLIIRNMDDDGNLSKKLIDTLAFTAFSRLKEYNESIFNYLDNNLG